MSRLIDLSTDIGEGFGAYRMGDDARILSAVTSATIACGFHAGDPQTMRDAVALSIRNCVGIGAQPWNASPAPRNRGGTARLSRSRVRGRRQTRVAPGLLVQQRSPQVDTLLPSDFPALEDI